MVLDIGILTLTVCKPISYVGSAAPKASLYGTFAINHLLLEYERNFQQVGSTMHVGIPCAPEHSANHLIPSAEDRRADPPLVYPFEDHVLCVQTKGRLQRKDEPCDHRDKCGR